MNTLCLDSSSRRAPDDNASRRDERLLAAARAGSSSAFQELEKLYARRLYRRIYSITRNHEDAEDALQDTFLRAFVALNSFEGRSQFSSWLTKIAINSALMTIRKRRNLAEVSLEQPSGSGDESLFFDVRDAGPDPEQICDQDQRRTNMLRAVRKLDSKSRSAIGLWIGQEFSLKEIARTLDVSVPTVKARLHRARKRLARSVASASSGPLPFGRNGFSFRPQHQEEMCLNCD
jgi:RNA polymerase sigma-70 factor, ECF subfamily